MTGMMAVFPLTRSNPAASIRVRKRLALCMTLLGSSELSSRSWMAFMVAPTVAGARVLEKRYGRDRCLSISMISFLPEVQPPLPPPMAFPKVVVMMSTLPISP